MLCLYTHHNHYDETTRKYLAPDSACRQPINSPPLETGVPNWVRCHRLNRASGGRHQVLSDALLLEHLVPMQVHHDQRDDQDHAHGHHDEDGDDGLGLLVATAALAVWVHWGGGHRGGSAAGSERGRLCRE